jgi:hypothetical protein
MTLIYSQNFETDFSAVPQLQSMGTIVAGNSSPAGIAGRMEIVNGAFKSTIVDTDPPTATGVRSECVFAKSALGDEDWITFEMRIKAEDWDDNGSISICQVHNKDSISAAVPILLIVKHNAWQIWTPAQDPPVEQQSFRQTSYPFDFDVWNKVTIHAKWLNTPAGFLEVFVNNISVHRRFDQGTAYNADTPYFKLGVYDATHNLGFGTKTAYFRNLKLYRGVESYSVAMGRGPKPRPRMIA